jgi:hypothetical protein
MNNAEPSTSNRRLRERSERPNVKGMLYSARASEPAGQRLAPIPAVGVSEGETLGATYRQGMVRQLDVDTALGGAAK